jgi:hypothetical protein
VSIKRKAATLALALAATTGVGAPASWADDGDEEEKCEEGRCCVGLIAFCNNEFPFPLPGNE